MKKFKKDNKRQSNRRDSRDSDREDSQDFDRRDSRRFERRGAHGSGRRDSNRRGFGRSRREPPTMHKAVCDECKKDCEVPFKPTSSKPIYCSDCFKKKDRSGSNNYEKEFDQINKKLDKILESLEVK